ncbi:efflux RND transporter periplasmic adaptor subunit [Hymenobacter sp. HDW8]|uniref:efflux RND transporter periplasmic adaptor subunit n=2 Tax=Hymenobacteraceae TaxID=1853232 RepID=UPI00140A5A0F|nr:efflux RND transporter periplasmic adaptor subunit [Hymenobacter sp. HDW8]QIL78185.1 efflux RND transporter periplasmic adaptor subunit [Hymenobacter sp. HDW8]
MATDAHQQHGKSETTRDTLGIDAGQQARAGLQTRLVTTTSLPAELLVLGTVAADENSTVVVSARVDGRLDHLYANTPGQLIRRGQPLYGLYSEQLLSDAQEYVRMGGASSSAGGKAAAAKLRLQGVSAAQIAALNAGPLPATLRFDSPAGGYLGELLVREGQYVTRGTPLLRITNAATVWVEAQLYASELQVLRRVGRLQVEVEAYPGQRFEARLVDERPVLEEDRKINLVRLQVANPDGQLRPGMMATVLVGQRARSSTAAPATALNVGNMTTVWVQTAPTVFERRMVRTGLQAGGNVEILSGVTAGERVVSSGAYLLESERELRRGGGAMAGMKM